MIIAMSDILFEVRTQGSLVKKIVRASIHSWQFEKNIKDKFSSGQIKLRIVQGEKGQQ